MGYKCMGCMRRETCALIQLRRMMTRWEENNALRYLDMYEKSERILWNEYDYEIPHEMKIRFLHYFGSLMER